MEHFGNLDFTTIEYEKVRYKFNGPNFSHLKKHYNKTFGELFKGRKKERNIKYSTEEELKQKCLEHFGHLNFSSKEYEEKRRLVNGPDTYYFLKYYGKTFAELFRGKKKESKIIWPTEEELKKRTIDYFKSDDFSQKQYREVRDLFNGPNDSAFVKIYGKTFQELFRGIRRKKRI